MEKEQNDWVNELAGVKKHKRVIRRELIETSLLLIFFEVVMICSIYNAIVNSKQVNLFVVFCMLVFGAWLVKLLARVKRSFAWKVDTSYIGVVTSKNRYGKDTTVKAKHRGYFIVAKVGEEEIEGRCLLSAYRKIKVGDKVALFTLGTKNLFATFID